MNEYYLCEMCAIETLRDECKYLDVHIYDQMLTDVTINIGCSIGSRAPIYILVINPSEEMRIMLKMKYSVCIKVEDTNFSNFTRSRLDQMCRYD